MILPFLAFMTDAGGTVSYTSEVQESFDGTSPAAGWTTYSFGGSASASWNSGKATVTLPSAANHGAGFQRTDTRTLDDAYALFDLTGAPSHYAFMAVVEVVNGSGASISLQYASNGDVYSRYNTGGGNSDGTTNIGAQLKVWLRIRRTGGNILWETAPDSSGAPGTWTTRRNVADSVFTPGFAGMTLRLYGYTWDSNTGGSFDFDSVNGGGTAGVLGAGAGALATGAVDASSAAVVAAVGSGVALQGAASAAGLAVAGASGAGTVHGSGVAGSTAITAAGSGVGELAPGTGAAAGGPAVASGGEAGSSPVTVESQVSVAIGGGVVVGTPATRTAGAGAVAGAGVGGTGASASTATADLGVGVAAAGGGGLDSGHAAGAAVVGSVPVVASATGMLPQVGAESTVTATVAGGGAMPGPSLACEGAATVGVRASGDAVAQPQTSAASGRGVVIAAGVDGWLPSGTTVLAGVLPIAGDGLAVLPLALADAPALARVVGSGGGALVQLQGYVEASHFVVVVPLDHRFAAVGRVRVDAAQRRARDDVGAGRDVDSAAVGREREGAATGRTREFAGT